MRRQIKYYNTNGNKIKYDGLTTFINNNNWVVPVAFWIGVLLTGIIEAL